MFMIISFFFTINQICARNGVGVVRVRSCVLKRLIITRAVYRDAIQRVAIGKLVAGGRYYFG